MRVGGAAGQVQAGPVPHRRRVAGQRAGERLGGAGAGRARRSAAGAARTPGPAHTHAVEARQDAAAVWAHGAAAAAERTRRTTI